MSAAETANRPSQVTIGAWGAAGAAVLLLVNIFDLMGRLHSVDLRRDVEKALSTGSASDLGLDVGQVLDLMRWGLLASGAAAAAIAVLAFWVLRRHTGARIGMSVAAIPVLLSSPLSLFLSGVVLCCVAMLWTGPARDWFAGRPVRRPQPVQRGTAPAPTQPTQPPPPAVLPPSGPDDSGPAPTQGFGTAPTTQVGAQRQPFAAPVPAYVAAPSGPTAPMPAAVRIACLAAAVLSAVAAAGMVAVMVVLATDSAYFTDRITATPEWDRLREQAQFDESLLLPMLWVMMAGLLLWCLAALGLAFLTWRRKDWARYLLVASAVLSALFGIFAFPISVLHVLGAGAVVGLLLSRPSREWFASAPRHWSPPPGPPLGPPPGPPSGRPPGPPYGPAGQQPPDSGPGGRPDVW